MIISSLITIELDIEISLQDSSSSDIPQDRLPKKSIYMGLNLLPAT